MSVLLLRGRQRIPLIRPGWLSGRMSFARAQAGGALASTLGADDATWSEVAADVPRYYGSARRLRVEGQRTNGIRNPRGGGSTIGVIGGGGSAPMYWSAYTVVSGLTTRTVSTGTLGGVDYVDFRVSGTPGSTGIHQLFFETTTAVSAATAQTWTLSAFVALSGGLLTNVAGVALGWDENTSGGAFVTNKVGTPFTPDATLTRRTHTATNSGGATVAAVFPWLRISVSSGQAIDVTLRIGWPTLELASFASTPILPAVGTPAAATRGADLLSAPLARLGVRDSGACTVLMTCMIPQAPSSSDNPGMVALDDGTLNNRVRLYNAAGGSTVFPARTTAGSSATGSSIGAYTAGAAFALGMTIDGVGRAAASLGGGSIQAVTGLPTSGLTTLRIGNNAANSGPMFGDAPYLDYLPFPVSDAQLQALVAAMPLS